MENHGCLIRFIPARRNTNSVEDTSRDTVTNQQKLSGDEARTFYEDLFKDDQPCNDHLPQTSRSKNSYKNRTIASSASSIEEIQNDSHESKTYDECSQSRKTAKNESESSRSVKKEKQVSTAMRLGSQGQSHNKLLSLSQNGDLEGLKKIFESETSLDIDYTDQYGWTSLMCATVARHKKVVEYLLSKGANRNIRNSSGKSAFDLAKQVSATKILNIFIGVEKTKPTKIKKERNPLFYCDICKANFSDSSEKKHSSSTVHLFNLKLKPKPDPFMIPESNIGYQLMRNSGWDGEAGLGPGGRGAKFPVKTVLKTDRSCLGSEQKEKKKAKITHFGPNDPESVSNIHKHSMRVLSARASSRKEERRRERKDKQWERNLRQYWNMDCDSITLDKL